MNKKLSIMLMMVFLLVSSMTGCRGRDESASSSVTQAPTVSYHESEIKLKSLNYVTKLALNSRGQLVLYDDFPNPRFVIVDKQGQEIRQIPCPKTQEKDWVDGSVFTLDREDRLYQLRQTHVNEQAKNNQAKELIQQLLVYSPVGKMEKIIDLGRMAGSNMDLNAETMVADNKDRFYILNNGGEIRIIDQTCQPIKSITDARYQFMDLDRQGNLMVIGRSGDDYFLARLNQAGDTVWKRKLDQIKTRVVAFKYHPQTNSFYIADYSGIKRYDSQGVVQGEVLNYRSTSFFISDAFIQTLAFDQAGQIYIALMYNGSSASGQPFSVYKYTPEKTTAKNRQQKVLTVGTIDPEPLTLEKAGRLFEKKHPGIRVEIKSYAGDAEYEKYVKTLNTEILSGKAPDIIAVEGLPYDKYIDKNVFVDLNAVMKKDKACKRQDYYENILKACEHRGRLYAMPISFNLPVMVADGSMLKKVGLNIDDSRWTWSDFHAAAKKVSQDTNNDGKLEIYALPQLGEGMLEYMLASNYRSFIDEDKKTAHFDSPHFIRFLNMYKSLAKNYMNPHVDEETLFFSGNRSSIAFLTDESFNGQLSVLKSEMGPQTVVLALPPGGGPKDRYFNAEMYAINRKSPLPKDSWEFLKFLTSQEQQASLDLNGIRINRLAQEQIFKKEARQSDSEVSSYCYSSDKGEKTVIIEPLTPEQIARTRQLIAHLNHCNDMNPQIRKLIEAEAASYMKGEKTAAQAAKVLQNKANLYLNE